MRESMKDEIHREVQRAIRDDYDVRDRIRDQVRSAMAIEEQQRAREAESALYSKMDKLLEALGVVKGDTLRNQLETELVGLVSQLPPVAGE